MPAVAEGASGATTWAEGSRRKIEVMRSLRPSRPSVSRGVPGLVTLAAALALTGCAGGADNGDVGPPRLTPNPQYDVAAEMIDSRPAPEERLNACELLGLTTAEVVELTGADMPEVEPTGSGDLGLICTYGGPGSPERAEGGTDGDGDDGEAGQDEDDDDDPAADSETSTGATTTTASTTDATTTDPITTTTTTATTTGEISGTTWDVDSDGVPDTFAAGVVEPAGGAEAALAGQPQMLGVRYACSDMRGPQALIVDDAPAAAPGAPAPIAPALATAYIDCIASPTGGGVEVHTLLVVDNYLWHITLLRPEVPRTPEAEAQALAGLHRVAADVLI